MMNLFFRTWAFIATIPLAVSFPMGAKHPMLGPLTTQSTDRCKQRPTHSTRRWSSSLDILDARSTKVVVVGAGIAGLSTAYNLWKLASDNCQDVDIEILEVRDRIGGRVQPVSMGDIRLDLGGQWVHEASNKNPIRKLIEDDLKLEFTQKQIPAKSKKNRFHKKKLKNVLFGQDGNLLENAGVNRAKTVFYKGFDDDPGNDTQTSFRDILDERIQIETLSDQKRNRGISSSESFDQAMKYFVHRAEGYEGSRLEEVTPVLDLYQGLDGPDRVVKGSYGSLLDALSSKMGLNKENGKNNDHSNVRIRQNTRVERINYGESSRISLSVVESEVDAKTLECDYCVCTVPLGVLKQRKIDFVPHLPEAREAAIDGIGMGILNKIVFRFDFDDENGNDNNYKFWGDLEQFGICHEDPAMVKTYYDCTKDYCDPDTNPRTAILIQFLAGSASDRVDPTDPEQTGLTDEQAIEESLEALRSAFGNVPHPTATRVTRWRNDPWACGAYSFAKVGSSADMYDEIASPLGRLLFAGEHTSKHRHSTVHGAWETGEREASRIFNQICDSGIGT